MEQGVSLGRSCLRLSIPSFPICWHRPILILSISLVIFRCHSMHFYTSSITTFPILYWILFLGVPYLTNSFFLFLYHDLYLILYRKGLHILGDRIFFCLHGGASSRYSVVWISSTKASFFHQSSLIRWSVVSWESHSWNFERMQNSSSGMSSNT